MNILADLFNKQQQISQNPVSVVRTPQQLAYEEMLNRQDKARKQEKIDNILTNVGSGLNGLGKVIANTTVKNPWQQEAVAKSLNANDDRLQKQIQDYAKSRAESRRNFVDEAKEQLALATADADKDYARQKEEDKYNYQKFIDKQNADNFNRQQTEIEKNNEFNRNIKKEELNTKNKENIDKINAENTDNYNQAYNVLRNLNKALELNKKNSSNVLKNFLIASVNPFSNNNIDNTRLAPLYSNYATETDEKKANMQLEMKGIKGNQSKKEFAENIKRLKNEEIEKLMQKGYQLAVDDNNGKLYLISPNGNNLGEI